MLLDVAIQPILASIHRTPQLILRLSEHKAVHFLATVIETKLACYSLYTDWESLTAGVWPPFPRLYTPPPIDHLVCPVTGVSTYVTAYRWKFPVLKADKP